MSSVWGSKDGRILVTGHYATESMTLWCLCTGQQLRNVDCGGKVKCLSGFGRLVGDVHDPLTIVVGCDSRDSEKHGDAPPS